MSETTLETSKSLSWDKLCTVLDDVAPGWRASAGGMLSEDSAAVMTIRELASAAEWGEYRTMRAHLRNELTLLREILNQPELPLGVQQSLRSHLQRLVRLL